VIIRTLPVPRGYLVVVQKLRAKDGAAVVRIMPRSSSISSQMPGLVPYFHCVNKVLLHMLS
jgi:hypothetical protein